MLKLFWCVWSADRVNMGKWCLEDLSGKHDLPSTGREESLGYEPTIKKRKVISKQKEKT
jgi:hypothetical protein